MNPPGPEDQPTMPLPAGQPANSPPPAPAAPSQNVTSIVSTPPLLSPPSTTHNQQNVVTSPVVLVPGSSGSQFVPSMLGQIFTGQRVQLSPAASSAATSSSGQTGASNSSQTGASSSGQTVVSSSGQTGAISSGQTGATSSDQTGASSGGQTGDGSSGQTSGGNSKSTPIVKRPFIKAKRRLATTLQGVTKKRRVRPRFTSSANTNVNLNTLLNNLLTQTPVRATNPPPPRDPDRVTPNSAPPQPPNWDEDCNDAIKSPDRFIKIRVEPLTPEYRTLAELVHSAPNLEVTGIQRVVNVHLWKKFLDMRKELLSSKSDDVSLLGNLGLNDVQIQQQTQACVNFNKKKINPSYADNVALLLHCTRSSVDKILSEGLDERLGKDSGCLGRGIYFTDNPTKAAHYDRNNVFIVSAVFLGDCSQVMGQKAYVRGQEKTDSQKRHKHDDYFDSIVGQPATADNEFVIYDRRQCVPIFLINYLKKTKFNSVSIRSKMYADARNTYPPFSWNPAMTQNPFPGLMTSPPAFIPAFINRWPFFAQTIFALMSQGSDATTTESPKPTDNMALLRSMGFTDDKINAQKLAENNNDLDLTVEDLLTLSQSPPPSAFGQPQTIPQFAIPQALSAFPYGQFPNAPPNAPFITIASQVPQLTLPSGFIYASLPTVPSGVMQAPTFNFGFNTAPAQRFVNPFHPTTTASSAFPTGTAPAQSGPGPSGGSGAQQQQEECLICRDEPTSWKTLTCCSQKICTICYAHLETSGQTMSGFTSTFVKCPFCKRIDGIEIGTCPDGEMSPTISSGSLDGHAGCNTIEVCYTVPAWNFCRIGYLPNSAEGNRALNLLKIAWDRRLVFSIGTSRTTGQSNVLVWNIHHKTGTTGGVQNHAYPDPTYLDRLLDELKQHGIQ